MYKKKSLGQHFLHSTHYLKLIAETARIQVGEQVLEIGPGDGALTRELLARGAIVTAIEKDSRLIPILKETFAKEISEHTLHLFEDDVLMTDIARLKLKTSRYKLVANIPYYITGAILKKFLSSDIQPSTMVLLVQKEVAERIARDTKESILSLSVKAYGTPVYIKTVPAGAFSPPPQVDSAILLIENISRKHFTSVALEEKFFALIKAGFAHKRKLLARNVEPLLGKKCSDILENVGIAKTARAEDVKLTNWILMAKEQI